MPKGSRKDKKGFASDNFSLVDNKRGTSSLLGQWSDFFEPSDFHADLKTAINYSDWTTIWEIYKTMLSKTHLTDNDCEQLLKLAYEFGINGNYKKSTLLYSLVYASEICPISVYRNLAVLLRNLQAFQCGLEVIDKYLAIKPNCRFGMNTKGILCSDLGMHQQALVCFSKALEGCFDYADAHVNIANEYNILANIDKSYYHSSLSIALGKVRLDSPILGDHFILLRRVCAHDKIASLDWWKVLRYIPFNCQQFYFLQYLVLAESEQDCRSMYEIVCEWGTNQPDQIGLKIPDNNSLDKVSVLKKKSDQDPLIIGFVSGDFRDHSVARFIWPLFKHIDRKRIKLVCFSTLCVSGDEWQNRFIQSADLFVDISSFSPYQLLSSVRSNKIDILFDLTGFTKGSRTRLFSLRLAPLQISWLGYPGTTGLKSMDYLFVDKFLKPMSEAVFSEKFAVTAGTSICFSQMDNVPISLICPQEKRGFVTFGSLNNPYKFTPQMLKAWAAVMHAVPSSSIYFVRREYASYYLRSNIVSALKQEGICESRIFFFDNRVGERHYLDCYNEIDLCMDTFPVTGGTTTVDSLWMGVPVVCLEGFNLHHRIGSSILRHAGLGSLVASTVDRYIQLSIELSNDLHIRKLYRKTLREQLEKSVLCDETQFTKDFENCMKSIYKGHNAF